MWFVRWLRGHAENVLIWCLCREAEATGYDLNKARYLAAKEVRGTTAALNATIHYQKAEAAAQEERLTRRFDIGMALNEAANRAMDEKKTLREHAARSGLTDRQLMALELQQRTLQSWVNRA